jgi:hypothetical protein
LLTLLLQWEGIYGRFLEIIALIFSVIEDLEKVLEERRENGTPKLRRKTAKAG